MRGFRLFVVFLALSVSLMCTTEAARSRTSNQNSFRRAANGVYQTLSSIFGEDNMKGIYKVSVGHLLFVSAECFGVASRGCFAVNGEQKTSALGPG